MRERNLQHLLVRALIFRNASYKECIFFVLSLGELSVKFKYKCTFRVGVTFMVRLMNTDRGKFAFLYSTDQSHVEAEQTLAEAPGFVSGALTQQRVPARGALEGR
jgi:hypothetical protein